MNCLVAAALDPVCIANTNAKCLHRWKYDFRDGEMERRGNNMKSERKVEKDTYAETGPYFNRYLFSVHFKNLGSEIHTALA